MNFCAGHDSKVSFLGLFIQQSSMFWVFTSTRVSSEDQTVEGTSGAPADVICSCYGSDSNVRGHPEAGRLSKQLKLTYLKALVHLGGGCTFDEMIVFTRTSRQALHITCQ